jgi:UPF0755 protein
MKSTTRKISLILAGIVFVIFAFSAYSWKLWNSSYDSKEVVSNKATVLLRVPAGASLFDVVDSLQVKKLIFSQRLFVYGTKLSGLQSSIKAGLFAIPLKSSPSEILRIITSGHSVPLRVTIPEGIDAIETANILSVAFGFSAQQFLADADSITSLIIDMSEADLSSYKELLKSGAGCSRTLYLCEGYLFPETYHFSEGTTSLVVAKSIIELGAAQVADLLASPISDCENMSTHEALTLASIVEAETIFQSEKPKVAAVYLNRMRVNHSLEADPTIAFFLSKKGKRIYYKDLRKLSPYNTYRNKGLPPGPINSPGYVAIRSVVQPEPNFDAFYFVADGKGGHRFSDTLKEHNQASAEYRKIRDNAR